MFFNRTRYYRENTIEYDSPYWTRPYDYHTFFTSNPVGSLRVTVNPY